MILAERLGGGIQPWLEMDWEDFKQWEDDFHSLFKE